MESFNHNQLQLAALECIRHFRVPDLQALLEYARLPRQGYKRDLYERCKLLLTSKWSIQLGKIVEQIDYHRTNARQSMLIARHHVNPTPVVLTPISVHENLPSALNIQYVRLPFFDVVRTVECANISVYRRTFSPLNFLLNNAEIDLICKGLAKVFLRLVPTILAERQNDISPPYMHVRINDQVVINNNILKIPGSPAHSIAFPTDITEKIFRNSKQINSIQYFWLQSPLQVTLKNLPESYTIAIQLVRKIPWENLHDEIIQRASPRKSLVRANPTTVDEELGLHTTRQSVSLICPITQALIKTPIKSAACSHLACFDLQAFLQMNERRLQWTCPICRKLSPFDSLYVDRVMEIILLNVPPNCSTVEIDSIPSANMNSTHQYIIDIVRPEPDDSFEKSQNTSSTGDQLITLSDDENLENVPIHSKISDKIPQNTPTNRSALSSNNGKRSLHSQDISSSDQGKNSKRMKTSPLKTNRSNQIELIILSSSDSNDSDENSR